VAVCLTTAFGSLLMGIWARLPIAIGCAISLTAFTAFGLVLGKGLSPAVALGTDSIIDLCVYDGDKLVISKERDLFAAWDDGKAAGLDGSDIRIHSRRERRAEQC